MSPYPEISSNIDVNLGSGGEPLLLFYGRDAIIEQGDTAKTSSVCLVSTLIREMKYNCTAARGNSELGLVKQYNPCRANLPSVQAFSVRRVRLPPLSEGGGGLLAKCLTFFF